MKFERIGDTLRLQARQTNIISYLKARHPKTIQFAGHPDAPKYVCWRGVEHDSITFYSKEDAAGNIVYRYTRHSTSESDDNIAYLVRYEGYTYPDAVKALAYFQDDSDT